MTVRSKLFYPLLALEGAGCAALAVWYSGRPAAGWLPALLAFPLEPLARVQSSSKKSFLRESETDDGNRRRL